MNKAIKLQSNEIILRQVTKEDIITREKLGLNIECIKMCDYDISKLNNFTYEDALKWYERIIKHPCKWIIEYKDNFVGVVSLRPYEEDNKAKYAIELYDEKIYNLGIGSKVTKIVVDYGFKILGYNKIYLRVLDYNTRAIKCYEKCGFIKEGIDREGALINGEYYSDIYMAIIKSNYESSCY